MIGGGSFDTVDTVAIGADGNIGVALPDQGVAMHAVAVLIVNSGVALATGLRDLGPGFARRPHIMRPVAVGANSCIEVSGRERLRVDAVQGFVVLLLMAIGANPILIDRVFAAGVRLNGRVGITFDLRVTLDALKVGHPVNGIFKSTWKNRQVQNFS